MFMQMSIRVGVIGASGFTGAELMRLIASHPEFELVLATGDTMAGRRAADLYPSLELGYPSLRYEPFDPDSGRRTRPRVPRAAARRVDGARAATRRLGRLRRRPLGCVSPEEPCALSGRTTASSTRRPALLADAVFGLPELHRDELAGAKLIATPGCHVTAATLALRPLVEVGVIKPFGIVVDTLTGITGAGRTPTDTNVFTNVDSNVFAYGMLESSAHARDGTGDRGDADLHARTSCR